MTHPALLAHGIGGRADLPISATAAQYGAVSILIATFLLLAFTWKQSKFESLEGRRVGWVQAFVDARATRFAMRLAGFIALFLTVSVALFGHDNPGNNPAPTWLYVWLWVGLIPASIVFGPVWRRIDPLPVITRAIRRVFDSPVEEPAEYPESWGRWPAAVGLGAFAWLELVAPSRALPETVALFVCIYATVHVIMGAVFGDTWHQRADAFGNYSDYFARLSPWARDDSGGIILTNPLRNLAALPTGPGSVAIVAVLLGATAFDGFTRMQSWVQFTTDLGSGTAMLAGTAVLAASVLVISATFHLAITVSSDTKHLTKHLTGTFAHSLIPIAAGYSVAHYFSLLIFQGQAGYLLFTDPFSRGWDILGTVNSSIDYSFLSSATIATVQVLAIAVGHLIGVIAAHDRAARAFPSERNFQAQLPLVTVMVLYTFGGIGLLLGA